MKVRARSSAVMRTGVATAGSPSVLGTVKSPRLLLERVVDDLLHRRDDADAAGRGILHDDKEHVLRAVDHEVDAAGAVPFDLAERARRRRPGDARIGADAKPIAETETIAGIVVDVAGNAGSGTDMIGG